MAFVPLQPLPFAGPRHTRQVPMSNCDASSGSTRNGAGEVMVYPSPLTSASVTAGTYPNAACVQSSDCKHEWIETPASLLTYQLELFAGSIATGPPSPPRICGQSEVGPVALFTPAVPFTPKPVIIVYGVMPTCDMLSTSASEPSPEFRF